MSSTKFSKDDLRDTSRLSSLALKDEELESFTQDLSSILEYVNTLSSVSTTGVTPTSHVHGVVNAFREDITKESLPVDEASNNAPDYAHAGFRVPKVVG